MIDPPRPAVPHAVDLCQSAGIKVRISRINSTVGVIQIFYFTTYSYIMLSLLTSLSFTSLFTDCSNLKSKLNFNFITNIILFFVIILPESFQRKISRLTLLQILYLTTACRKF